MGAFRSYGGGGGTAGPYLSIRAGLYLHPVARMRGVLFAAPGFWILVPWILVLAPFLIREISASLWVSTGQAWS